MVANMNKVTVAKFGGTSMENVDSMLQCAQLLLDRKNISLAVVSATSGTTKKLLNLANKAQEGFSLEQLSEDLNSIKKTHLDMANKLNMTELSQLDEFFNNIITITEGISLLRDASLRTIDSLLSIGEQLSSVLFQQALKNKSKKRNVVLFDIKKVMLTNNQHGKAVPLYAEIKQSVDKLLRPLLNDSLVVTQGFIGATKDGITTTLGIEGSDFSAAILAEALDSQQLEIWTDVDGILTADPRKLASTKSIHEISYDNAIELSLMGAKILHPETLWPAKRGNIPIFVGNCKRPPHQGTHITLNPKKEIAPLAISLKENLCLMKLHCKDRFLNHQENIDILNEIQKYIDPHYISSGLITFSHKEIIFLLERCDVQKISNLKERLECKNFYVEIEQDLGLISVIGNQLNNISKFKTKCLDALGNTGFKIFNNSDGDSSFSLLVSMKHLISSGNQIHKALFH